MSFYNLRCGASKTYLKYDRVPGGSGGVGVLEAANSGEGLWGEIWLRRPPMCLLSMMRLLDGGNRVGVKEAAHSGEGLCCDDCEGRQRCFGVLIQGFLYHRQ